MLFQLNPIIFAEYFTAVYAEAPLSSPVVEAPVVDIVEATTRILGGNACGIGAAWSDDGLEVNITNWQAGYVLQGRYFTSGGAFGSWTDMSTWAPVNVSGNDAHFFADNSGDSAPGAAGWEVRVVSVDALDTAISNTDTLNYNIVTDPSTFVCNGVPTNLRWESPEPTALACGSVTSSFNIKAVWDAFDGATQYEYSVTTPGIPVWNTFVGTNEYNGAFTEGEGVYTYKIRATAPYTSAWSVECPITYAVTPTPVTYIVRPSDMQGFVETEQFGALINFIDQPDSPLPTGALQLTTTSSTDDRSRITKTVEIPLDDIANLSFDAKKVVGPSYAGAALRLGLDNDGNGDIDQTIVYEPYYNGAVLDNTWQTWSIDQSTGFFWGSWNPAGGYDTNQPLSSIPGTSTATIVRSIGLGLGNWNPSWEIIVEKLVVNHVTYDFEMDPIVPNEAPQVQIVDPSPTELGYVRGSVTGRALATDDTGMGSYYLRFWKDAFESGIDNLVGNCQEAPGGNLLGTSLDETCVYDSTSNPDGLYVFSAQFLDEDIEWGQALRSFYVDNTRPELWYNNPSSAGQYVNGIYNVEVSATDNMMLNRIAVNVYNDTNTVFLQACGSTPASPSIGLLAFTFDCNLDTTGLSDGTYTLRSSARDEAGNIKVATTTIIVDNTGPEVGGVEVFPDFSPFVNGLGFVISADVSDVLSGIDKWSCAVTTNFEDASPSWTPGAYLFGKCISGALFRADGEELEINVKVSDKLGNTSFGTTIYRTADRLDPTFNSFEVTPIYGTFTSANPTLLGEVDDTVSPITQCQGRYKISSWSPWINGVLSLGVTPNEAVCEVNLSGLTPGSTYDFQMRVKDSVGHWENSSVIWNITVDNTVPVSNFITPESNFSTNQPIDITGESTDNAGVDFVTVYFGDYDTDSWTELAVIDNPLNDTPFMWQYLGWTPAEGTYDLKVTATDVFGNVESTDYVYNITYNTTGPTILGEALTDESFVEGTIIPTVDITVEDPQGVDQMCLDVVSSPFGLYNWFGGCIGEDGEEGYFVPSDVISFLEKFDTSVLPEGDYEIEYYFTDDLGNESEYFYVTYTITNFVPVVSLESDQTITVGSPASFLGAFEDLSCNFDESEFCENWGESPDDRQWSAVVDFGDGTLPVELTGDWNDTPGEITLPNHIYANIGVYIVTLEVCEAQDEFEYEGDYELQPARFIEVVDYEEEVEYDSWSEGECGIATVTVTVEAAPVVPNLVQNVILFGNLPATNNAGTVEAPSGTNFTITANLNVLGNPNYNYTFGGICSGAIVDTGLTQFTANTLNLATGNYVCSVTVSDSNGDVDTASVLVEVASVLGVGDQAPETENETEDEEEGQIEGSVNQVCEERYILSGSIFNDLNTNNEKDSNESGVAGVLVQLYYMDELDEVIVAEETTSADGEYQFEVCPGNYNVRIAENDVPEELEVLGASDKEVLVVDEDVENFDFVLVEGENTNGGFNWWIFAILLLIIAGGTGIYLYTGRKSE